MAVFNGAVLYSGVYFTDSAVADVVKTGTGGIDPEGRRRKQIHLPFKPTGILDRPIKEGRKDVQDRVDESRQIQAEIAGRLAKEFSEATQRVEEPQELEILRQLSIEHMTQTQIDAEIGVRLRKKLKDEEDELVLILLIAATSV